MSLNIRAKLILISMLTAGLAMAGLAWVSYMHALETSRAAVSSRLAGLASVTARQVELYFETSRANVAALSHDLMMVSALDEFTRATAAIPQSALTPEFETKLLGYYEKNFVPNLEKHGFSGVDAKTLVPASHSGRYLQSIYLTTRADNLPPAIDVGGANTYASVHARYHQPLETVRSGFQYADLFLIDPNGRIVYTALKEPDFQSDLMSGPFSESGLARAFVRARAERVARPVVTVDYSFYQPSFGAPAAFMAAPVFDDARFVGVIAVQLAADRLNTLVTNGGKWKEIGLGDKGDIFIAGRDRLMRTTVRPFESDRKSFFTASRINGMDQSSVDRMAAYGSPILLQRASTDILSSTGDTSEVAQDFLGRKVLASASRISIPGLEWLAVAQLPEDEAYADVSSLGRKLAAALALASILATLATMALAEAFVRPMRRLMQRMKLLHDGDFDAKLRLGGTDEISDLSSSMQDVVDGLRADKATAERDKARVEKIINRFLPDGIARLVRGREERSDGKDEFDDIAYEVPNASFVLGRLSGYESMFANLAPSEAVNALDQLVQVVDLAAERNGVEKVRTSGDSYFAIAGLSAPLLDHRQRALAFAMELREIVDRFRAESGVGLQVKVGISSGSAVSGIIGREKLAYDVWGQPVGEMEALNAIAHPGEIRVTEDFVRQLDTTAEFAKPPDGGDRGGLLLVTHEAAGAGKP